MRSQRLKGSETTVVYSKRGNLLGIISVETVSPLIKYKCHVYVYCSTGETLHTIGHLDTYDKALNELRRYEQFGEL